MNYTDYIIQHKDEIKTSPWKKVNFEDVYKKSLEEIKHPIFRSVINEYKKRRELTRDDIFSMVGRDNLVESFLTIILWGGLNPANINRVMSDFEGIETKLKNTFDLINGNEPDGLYNAFCYLSSGGKNHINGINTSFFTKILYFFDQKNGSLIYDNWGRQQHCALIASDNKPIEEYYSIFKEEGKRTIRLSIANGRSDWDLYCDYLKRMREIAKKINLERVDKLEEFLFGYYQRKYDIDNPRYILLSILGPFCRIVESETKPHTERIHQRKIWSPFCEFKSLSGTNHTTDSLIKGYCVPIDNEQFHIFVAQREKPNKNGSKFFCKLMYKKGREKNEFCLSNFPYANRIVRDYFDYHNKGNTIHSYWFRDFKDEGDAVDFMEGVYDEICLLNGK